MKKYWPLFLIVPLIFISFTFRLGRDLLWDWDECLYGQYAKEMVATGHYLTNIWNGYIDLQKPPLYSWILALAGGGNASEFTLRLVNVIGAIAILIALYIFTIRKFNQRTAVLATLILLTAEVFVIYSMKLSTDILFALLVFLGFWQWLETKDRGKGWGIVWAGVLFGIATMMKGLGSLQFITAITAATLLFPSRQKVINLIKMTAAFAAVIIPWHAVAYLTYGDRFLKVYIYDNIIKRSKYPIEFHRERIWFYFVLLYKELKPWIYTFFLFPLVFIINSLQTKRNSKWLRSVYKEMKKKELIITLLILFLIPLASISRVQTRIAWYILPLYPFLAIILAYNIDMIIGYVQKKQRVIGKILYSIILILLVADVCKLLYDEVKPYKKNREFDTRYEAILQTKKYPEKELHYLVPPGERLAKELLPPTEQIDMTWVYGGNPCAVYYSDKKVNYYYSTKEFEQKINTKAGLYLVQNNDSKLSVSLRSIYRNPDFSLLKIF